MICEQISEVKGILCEDPFVTLDEEGVGELIKVAMSRGKSTRPEMPMGICGEHGGDPKSIDFCQRRVIYRILYYRI